MVDERERHIERLKVRSAAVLSLELKTRTSLRVENGEGKPAEYDTIVDSYLEGAEGARRCFSERFLGVKRVGRNDHYSDGAKCADVSYSAKDLNRQASVVIKETYSTEGQTDKLDRPMPLSTWFVGREPLHEALGKKAETLGSVKIEGRDCDRYLFRSVRWYTLQDHVYDLDGQDSVVLRIQAFAPNAVRNEKSMLWEWKATSIQLKDNRPVATDSRMTAFNEGRAFGTWDYSVQSMHFNKKTDPSDFWPEMKPGTVVFDVTTGEQKVIPGDAPLGRDTTTSPPAPVAAEPTSQWTPWLSRGALALGAALLLAGLVIWWRGRRT